MQYIIIDHCQCTSYILLPLPVVVELINNCHGKVTAPHTQDTYSNLICCYRSSGIFEHAINVIKVTIQVG